MTLDPRTRRQLQYLRAKMQAHFVAWCVELDRILDEDAGPTTIPADLGPDTTPGIHPLEEDRRRR